MSETSRMTDHQDIRDWAAARTGRPAITQVPTGTGETTQALSLVFGQQGIHDTDENNTDATELREMVEWDAWFEVFEREELVLLVPNADVIDDDYQLLKR